VVTVRHGDIPVTPTADSAESHSRRSHRVNETFFVLASRTFSRFHLLTIAMVKRQPPVSLRRGRANSSTRSPGLENLRIVNPK
jgi:hypothetical protein